MMRVHEINRVQELESLRATWTALLEQTPRAQFFQTLDWLQIYWEYFGKSQKLRVLLVETEGQITGILPLTVCKESTRVGPIRFLTYPLANWGSYYGPIGADPAYTLAAGLKHLALTPRDWQALELRFVHPDDDRERITERALRANGFQACRTVWDQTAVIDLSGDWNSYLTSRSPKWRKNCRRWLRRLNEQGEVRLVRYRPAGEAEGETDPRWDLYDLCVEIAQQSWQGSSTTGTTLTHAEVRNYLRDTHAASARVGAVDLNLLYIGQRPAAFAYNYYYAGNLFGLRMGFDPAASHHGIGNVLYMHTIEDSFARGDFLYDMGPGSLEAKKRLLTRIETIWRYSHFPLANPRAQLLRARRWLESRARIQESEGRGQESVDDETSAEQLEAASVTLADGEYGS